MLASNRLLTILPQFSDFQLFYVVGADCDMRNRHSPTMLFSIVRLPEGAEGTRCFWNEIPQPGAQRITRPHKCGAISLFLVPWKALFGVWSDFEWYMSGITYFFGMGWKWETTSQPY